MKPTYEKIPKKLLEETLKAAALAMPDGKWFAFFGTLLGLVREGGLISGDDDVDIYVHANDTENVVTSLENAGFVVKLDYRPEFIQFVKRIGRHEIPLDLYFFQDSKSEDVISEKWNFSGPSLEPKNVLKIPKNLLFPLKEIALNDIAIAVPAMSESVCHFLYGPDWQIPKQKLIGYRIEIIDGTPCLQTPTLRESLSTWNEIYIYARVSSIKETISRWNKIYIRARTRKLRRYLEARFKTN